MDDSFTRPVAMLGLLFAIHIRLSHVLTPSKDVSLGASYIEPKISTKVLFAIGCTCFRVTNFFAFEH